MAQTTTFLAKTLSRAKSPTEYKLYVAALEWSLEEPIVIDNRNDIKSTQSWADRLKPYDHQINNLINFCRRLPVTLIADDVGLGKTISAGLIISELISRRRISKIIIVTPKILLSQWQEELETKFNIQAKILVGSDINEIRNGDFQAILTTYSTARLHFSKIEKLGFDMVILDEAHKLRNLFGASSSPQIAKVFYQAFKSRTFKYVIMLTATPIQNRLWDIYSLIELLTSARGVNNPFGNAHQYEKNYILDDPKTARKLKPESQDKFRSVVYGYMSRIRRNQINLFFPERMVKLIKVNPSINDMKFLHLIYEPIKKLNPLSQISLLQASVSSSDALAKQLENMSQKGTISNDIALKARLLTNENEMSAKLYGLDSLIKDLILDNPENWRVVVFTCRRETQTMIHKHLSKQGFECGIINGDSHDRNQLVIQEFNKQCDIKMHVIISTDAGSEGLNLQIANVLVNYDLPWNPMIVEQRIGRLQRLSSEHAKIIVMNITLRNTFEERIVCRLMEKIQLAFQAIGDIDSLLQPLGIEALDEDSTFEQKIRELVLESLSGKDVEAAIANEESNIINAKQQLEENEIVLNELLGDAQNYFYQGPRLPKLQQPKHSIELLTFIKQALSVTNKISEEDITPKDSSTLLLDYSPGKIKFDQLVSQLTESGQHFVEDLDISINHRLEETCKNWVAKFGGIYQSFSLSDCKRRYVGVVLLRIRVTVAYDSYEKIIYVDCNESHSDNSISVNDIETISLIINSPAELRISTDFLISKAIADDSVSEFCRFYSQQLEDELNRSGNSDGSIAKIIDDLTPRIVVISVGLQGIVKRTTKVIVNYSLEKNDRYTSHLTLISADNQITEYPDNNKCEVTGKILPADCFARCEMSDKLVVKNLLFKSDISNRYALQEYFVLCAISGKKIILDEAVKSDITNKYISKTIAKTSSLSGKNAEPEYFGVCEFTLSDVLTSELAASQFSGKRYRNDEKIASAASGKTGHKSEFIKCAITNQPLFECEGEKSELSGAVVMPGLLEQCYISGKWVLPSELDKSVFSSKKALKKYFVISSITGAHLLEQEAIQSSRGNYCSPSEAKLCFWSGNLCHIEDLRICNLTRLTMHFSYINKKGASEVLSDILSGVNTHKDKFELWSSIIQNVDGLKNLKNSKIVNAALSPDGKKLALRIITKNWFGLNIQYYGMFYSLVENLRIGRIIYVK